MPLHANRSGTHEVDASSLIDDLVDDLQPVKPMRWQMPALGVLTMLAIGFALVAGVAGLRALVVEGRLDVMFVLSAGLLFCLSAAATHAVFGMAQPEVGHTRAGVLWPLLMASLLPIAAVIVAVLQWLQTGGVTIDASGVLCLALGVFLGSLVAGVLTAWLRRGAPTSPSRAGWLVGLAAGSAGMFLYTLHCPDNDILHIGVWHGGAVIVSALLGRLIVPPLIRW